MKLTRRSLLVGILGAGIAPAFVSKPMPIWVPRSGGEVAKVMNFVGGNRAVCPGDLIHVTWTRSNGLLVREDFVINRSAVYAGAAILPNGRLALVEA